ncbi:Cytochrome P450 94A1 [Acorus gramineus]|uniref:Cytochrome P450 94A1 n=1 Tax=Acorus gramineus TaxID=55184 RepID=A0AAV9AIH7_ACOGR|nr:Cytochrome P450 94A1 [Acorus gramineus]
MAIVHLSLLIGFFIIITLSLQLLRRTSQTNHGPPTYPLIGCLLSFHQNRRRLLDWYTDLLAASPSYTISIRRLGARRTIVTANPKNVEHVLKTNFDNYPKGKPFTDVLGDLLGRGIFNSDADLWRSQRKLASHEFSTRAIKDFVERTLESEARERLVPVLAACADEGTDLDMQDALRRFAFDTICRVSLGFDPACLGPSMPESRLARAFDGASDISARRATEPVQAVWRLKRALRVGSERALRRDVRVVHESVAELIRARKEEKAGGFAREDLLSRLVSGGRHDEEVIRDATINMIMAGRDTTSAALTWFFFLLARNPDAEARVVEEAMAAKEGRVDYEALKEMRFLEACLCESMRLYPPVPWDSKHAVEGDVLPDGTEVRKGDRVTYFAYGMGRREGLWGEDCREFRPERWMNGGVSAYKWPVFQAGPRVCLGREMAMAEMKCVAVEVLSRFKVRPAEEGVEPMFVPLLTAHMKGGFKVRVRRWLGAAQDVS